MQKETIRFMTPEEVMRYMIRERKQPSLRIQGTTSKWIGRKCDRDYYRYKKFIESRFMEEKKYTLKDLVSFGNYLLSEERNTNIASEEAKKYVGDWDIANWKVKG